MIKNYTKFKRFDYSNYDLIAIIGRGNVAKAIYKTLPNRLKDKYSSMIKYDPYSDKEIPYVDNLEKYLHKHPEKKVLVIFANMYGTKWKVNQGILDDTNHILQNLNFVSEHKSNPNIEFLLISSIDCAMVEDKTYQPGLYANNRIMLEKSFARLFENVNNKAYIIRLPMLAGIGKNWMYDLDNHNLRPRTLSEYYVDRLRDVIIRNINLDVWIEAESSDKQRSSVRYLNKYLKEDEALWSDLGLHMNMWMNELDNYVVLDTKSINFADKLLLSMKNRKIVTAYDYQTTVKDYIDFIGNDELSNLFFDRDKPIVNQGNYIQELSFEEIY